MDTPSTATPFAERVLREQVAAFLLIFNTIFRARMAFALLIGALMYTALPSQAVVVYTVCHFLLSLLTLQMPRWMRPVPRTDGLRWRRAITVCTIAAGVADGIAPWFFVRPGSVNLTAVLMVVMLANCARAVQSLRPFKVALVGHVLAAMLPLIVALIYHGGTYYYFLAGFATVHLAMLLRAGLHEADQLTEALTLRFENEALAQRLREQVLETERASLEKTRFMAAASHDLRQPLHAVSLFGATLENLLAGKPEGEHARRLMQAVHALSHSLETLLDVSRMDAGGVAPAFQPVPLDPLFRRLDDVFGPLAEQRGLQLRIRASGVWVCSDPQLLSRMLSNLVDNALKYTLQGGVIVTARRRSGHVRIEVRDTGIGIAPDQQARIFDEFYQVGNPGRDRALGLGIGLAIVKRLARLLDHPVTLQSQPLRGTCFRLSLPPGDPGAARGGDATPARPAVPTPDDGPRRVLLLDDEADIRGAMAALFATWGIALATAADAAEAEAAMARAAAAGERFDLLICDYRLSGEADGAAVGQALRARFDATLPLLLITGETAPQRLAALRQSGIAVIAKPIDASVLRKILGVMARRAQAD